MRASHPQDLLLTCQWPQVPVGCLTWEDGCLLAVKVCRQGCQHRECPAVLACRNKQDPGTVCMDRAKECLVLEVPECHNKECLRVDLLSLSLALVSSPTQDPSLVRVRTRIPSACHSSSSRDLGCQVWGATDQHLDKCQGCLLALVGPG